MNDKELGGIMYHANIDGVFLTDEDGDMVEASVCICHAWSAYECCCGAWDEKAN